MGNIKVDNQYIVKKGYIELKIYGGLNKGIAYIPKYYLEKVMEHKWFITISKGKFIINNGQSAMSTIIDRKCKKTKKDDLYIFNFTNILFPWEENKITGVFRTKENNYRCHFKEKQRSFSINKYGEEEAQRLAIEQRKIWELEEMLG